jgi:Mg2+-importing ATPase
VKEAIVTPADMNEFYNCRQTMITSKSYWARSSTELLHEIKSDPNLGIDEDTAVSRVKESGKSPERSQLIKDILLLVRQFRSPLQIILIVAIILASVLGEFGNSLMILLIVGVSGVLGFWQERRANRAIEKLQKLVQIYATVIRGGLVKEIPASGVVPGDIVLLNAGDIIAGDGILLEANDLHVNEAILTGESFPAEKLPGVCPESTPLVNRKNCVYQGTNVVNGTARVLILRSGPETEFGKISKDIARPASETASEKAMKKFGFLIMRVTLFFALLIMILNIFLGKPATDSILFSLALAVGMTPELLPTIVTVTLSAGASRMAGKKVIVKKLSAIQNLGAINVFCSDKTGTLTEGLAGVQSTLDGRGVPFEKVKIFAYLNSVYETGFTNPIDNAIRKDVKADIAEYKKVDEVPYDFIRKRLSVAFEFHGSHLLITKGATKNIIDVCSKVEFSDGHTISMEEAHDQILETERGFASQGFRTIAVCYKDITGDPVINKDDEFEMIFVGFVVFADSLKHGIEDTVSKLVQSGIALKVVTGDNSLVAAHICSKLGLEHARIITGREISQMSEDALMRQVNEVSVFAEIEPRQKERIVMAFRKAGNVVGYIGDGINDAAAIKAADVGISVDTAVDVAKETADIVLLDKDLKVVHDAILEGRKTIANTQKYIHITTSANFGNMFSVAGASLLLPFLPLIPVQILLLNLITDLPAVAIASDNVDKEILDRPTVWDNKLIQRFMIVFGIESSLFDFITFSILLWGFAESVSGFQTGWFLESVLSEILILLVLRTRKPFMRSKPGRLLIYAIAFAAMLSLLLIYLPISGSFGFQPLPLVLVGTITGVALVYGLAAEWIKTALLKRRH